MLLVLKQSYRERKMSSPPLLVAFSSKFPTTAQNVLLQIYPPMFPPKHSKPYGSHHRKVEGVSGNLLAIPWPPQGRIDDKHGEYYSQ